VKSRLGRCNDSRAQVELGAPLRDEITNVDAIVEGARVPRALHSATLQRGLEAVAEERWRRRVTMPM
jgi:hypothetical protein